MDKDACNEVTTDRGSTIVEAFQVQGSKFCPVMGRDACNDVTADRDSIIVAYVPSSEFWVPSFHVLRCEPQIYLGSTLP